jgi:hypothetical protein
MQDGPNDKIQAVIDSGVCRRIVELLMNQQQVTWLLTCHIESTFFTNLYGHGWNTISISIIEQLKLSFDVGTVTRKC